MPQAVTRCRSVAVALMLVALASTRDNACTDDLGVTTSVVRLPATVDNTQGLLVRIDGTTTRLAAR
jgi:hypothetical protein